MAVRSSMSDLITRVRQMIADPAGTSALFTDQDVQDKLDECRQSIQYEELEAIPTFASPSGAILYTDYQSVWKFWESDATLLYGYKQLVTPDVSEYIAGRFTFTAGQFPPVVIKGKTYDVYRAAADLLEIKITSAAMTSINFTADGQSFQASYTLAVWEKRVQEYRAKQRPLSVRVVRSDLTPSGDGSNAAQTQQYHPQAGPVSAFVPFINGD